MKEIEIFLHVEGEAEPKLVKAAEDELVEVFLARALQGRHTEHVLIFEDIVLEPKKHLHEHGIKHHHHVHCHRKVEIKINGKPRWTHKGRNSVEHLRKLGEVPADEILSEFKGGQYVDLDNTAHVEICGGELFASHVKSGGSS